MRIIDRYVLWSFVKNYLISFMVLVGMYIVLDMVFNFDELVDLKGTATAGNGRSVLWVIYNIANYYFYQAFLFFVHLSGIIPVVAAAFTLMRLSRFNEVTALLAAGVPLLRVSMPIIIAGVVLNALVIVDQEVVIPRLLPKVSRDRNDVHRTDVESFPIQAMQDSNKGLLYGGRYTPATGNDPPIIETFDLVERREPAPTATGRPSAERGILEARAHVSADRAVWNEAGKRWDLFTWDPGHKEWLPHGRRVAGLSAVTDDLAPRAEKVASYRSNVTPEEIALYRSGDWVELLSTSRINELIKRPGSYGQADLLRVKHWRFTQPVMNVILLLLAIPCVLTREPGRLKTAATKCLVLTGLGMGSIFLSHQLAGRPPADPAWTYAWPALMAWLPIFAFGPLAVFLLDRVKT